MTKYISKSALVAEIEKRMDELYDYLPDASKVENGSITTSEACNTGKYTELESFKDYVDILDMKDPYKQCIQYPSVKDGIKAHAEDYSFNIESELFNQLTREQQELWRKEIEYACISGGDAGYLLAKDPRYKENIEVKEVDLQSEIDRVWDNTSDNFSEDGWKEFEDIAKHFFELGMQASNPLTWEDMMTIHKCCKDAMNCNLYAWETAEGQQKIYEDVLKRFKAQKGE